MALALTGGVGMACCQWLIYAYAPLEIEMGLVQKIFYSHLPLAWIGMLSFLAVFLGSVAWLWSRKPFWDELANSAAEIGVLFTGLALITGAVWAKKAWGVWWAWEPRLTTALVMWFMYAGYLILRGLGLPENRRAVAQAVLGIAAFLDVPLVFLATRLQRARHPVGIMSSGDGLEPEMRLTIYACLLCAALFWLALLMLRCRLGLGERRAMALARRREEA